MTKKTMPTKYLIVVAGPTASGKTTLAIELAQYFQTEILSCDSRQFYREMNIGTAKPTKEELQQATHHFINSLSIEQDYSVGDYEREALAILKKIYHKKDIAILVGGSGLFIRALCEGLDEFPDVPTSIRQDLESVFKEKGIEALQQELLQSDPLYYEKVDLNNPVRLIRALGVCRISRKPFTSFQQQPKKNRFFTPIYLKIVWDREKLYERINRRVDLMLKAGLLEEAQALHVFKDNNALQTVGYQELFDYFDEKISLEEAIRLIKRNSRRYAKRQMTWLRKDKFWKEVKPGNLEDTISYIENKMITFVPTPKGNIFNNPSYYSDDNEKT